MNNKKIALISIIFIIFNLQSVQSVISAYVKITKAEAEDLIQDKPYTVQQTKVSKYTRSSFYLDYQYFINAYGLDLYEVDSNGDKKQIDTVAEDKEISYGSLDGCVAQNRDIDYQLNFVMNVENSVGSDADPVTGLPDGFDQALDQLTLSDMSIDTENQVIYVFHHDFKFQQITYTLDEHSGQMKSLKLQKEEIEFHNLLNLGNTDIEDANSSIKVVNHEGYVYVITHYGTVYFQHQDDVNSISVQTLAGFQQRESIHRIRVAGNTIFVASGTDGLDIYRIGTSNDAKVLTHLQQLTIDHFKETGSGQQDIDVNDVSYDLQRDALYVLESGSGLHMYSYSNINEPITQSNIDDHLYIPILYGKYFDYHLNTFIVIQEIQNVDFGFEFYLNFDESSYFINNQFYQDLKFHDVIVEADYAILLSDYSHRVVYHSIYKGFANESTELHDYFYDPYIKQMKIIKATPTVKDNFVGLDYHDVHYVIGLKFNGINVHRIKLRTPTVKCQARTHGIKKYELKLTSQLCPTEYYNDGLNGKTEIESYELFNKCTSTHIIEVNFKVKPEDDDKEVAGIVVAIVLIFIALFIIGGCVWYQLIHKKQIQKQKNEISDYEQKKNQALQNRGELEQKIQQKQQEQARIKEEIERKKQHIALQDNDQDEVQSHEQQYQIDDDDDIEIDSYIPPANNQQKPQNSVSPGHGRQSTQKGLVNTEENINFDHAPETEAKFRQQKSDQKQNKEEDDDDNENELVDF